MKIEEVAVILGVSTQTINRWYKFKKQNPNHELSQTLPPYRTVKTLRGWARVWNPNDIWKLVQFRTEVKAGRNGLMGKYEGKGTKNVKNEN